MIYWFDSFLHSRVQVSRVNGIDSEEGAVVCVVPQWSILAPLIFIP